MKFSHVWLRVLGVGGVLLSLAYLSVHDPVTSPRWIQCPFYFFTGLYCPGCGTLRATYQLLHGHLIVALDYNPMYVLMLPYLLYGVVTLLRPMEPPRFARMFRHPMWVRGFIAAYFAFGIIRNLPFYPCTVLAP